MTQTITSTIQFPYKRSLGPVLGAFMTALTECRIIGIRNGKQVICPPLEWDPKTGAELEHDFVDVGPGGKVVSWTWVSNPTTQHPLQTPFAFALIKLDGATTTFMHAVDTGGDISKMKTGLRVVPRWRTERVGHINDIEAFVPGRKPKNEGGPGATEPVTMMPYNASITYTNPVSPMVVHFSEATAREKLIGSKCPGCAREYTMGRSYCPICSLELTPEHDIELPQTGTITNFTIITPIQYPGQTETEDFARCMVKLDDHDVTLGFQPVIDTPVDQIRVGMRVSCVFASEAERSEGLRAGNQNLAGYIVGWIPTGEPDVEGADYLWQVM